MRKIDWCKVVRTGSNLDYTGYNLLKKRCVKSATLYACCQGEEEGLAIYARASAQDQDTLVSYSLVFAAGQLCCPSLAKSWFLGHRVIMTKKLLVFRPCLGLFLPRLFFQLYRAEIQPRANASRSRPDFLKLAHSWNSRYFATVFSFFTLSLQI